MLKWNTWNRITHILWIMMIWLTSITFSVHSHCWLLVVSWVALHRTAHEVECRCWFQCFLMPDTYFTMSIEIYVNIFPFALHIRLPFIVHPPISESNALLFGSVVLRCFFFSFPFFFVLFTIESMCIFANTICDGIESNR